MVTISIGVGNSTKDIEVGLTMTARTNYKKGFTGIVGIITPPNWILEWIASMFCFRLTSTGKSNSRECYQLSLTINPSLKNANIRTNTDLLRRTHIILLWLTYIGINLTLSHFS